MIAHRCLVRLLIDLSPLPKRRPRGNRRILLFQAKEETGLRFDDKVPA